jgi:hypothetical protein
VVGFAVDQEQRPILDLLKDPPHVQPHDPDTEDDDAAQHEHEHSETGVPGNGLFGLDEVSDDLEGRQAEANQRDHESD